MSWFTFSGRDFAFSFLSILFEGIPFLLLGSLISGAVDAFVPSHLLTRFLPKRPAVAVVVSGLLGLIFPICECGSVVVIRRFIRKGFPVSCAVTYMLAAPIVSPVVALSTFAAFKGQNPALMTSLRLSLGFAIAVLAGFIASRLSNSTLLQPAAQNSLPDSQRAGLRFAVAGSDAGLEAIDDLLSTPQRLVLALRSASTDFLDVAFFLVLGAAITAVFNTSIDQMLILPLAQNASLATPALMGLAFILALCSTSDAFIAASLVAFPFVSKLAFLVFGPMFDVKLLFLYSSIFRKRVVAVLGIGLFVLIALICLRLQTLNL